MAFDKKFLLFPILMLLAACGSYVKKVDYERLREVPETAAPAPILFNGAKFILPPGQEVGYASASTGCGWPRRPISRVEILNAIDHEFLAENFANTLESVGYDVVNDLNLIIETADDEILRAEYTVTAKIKAAQMDLCQRVLDNFLLFFTTRDGIDGETYLSVDWTVYDPIERKVVYETTTEGYTKTRTPSHEGPTLMLHEAFEMATHNLGTDEKFYNLIVNGLAPNTPKPGTQTANFDSRRIFDPLEPVTIHQNGLSTTPFTQNIAHKQKNAVMIQKIGHGSGFFISDQGHIITNAHVVGDSNRTRIVTADQEQELSAEILRIDKKRDVALLKLESIPEGMKIVTMPIRPQIPNVGEQVYVLGTPKDSRLLQNTLTGGIVSAYRKNLKTYGLRANFIQSDVEIHGGNSGGPMYDENGNIIGISVIGLHGTADKIGSGLNLFIPIAEALDSLDITLQSEGL